MVEGKKKFINKTGQNINITMFIRAGGTPKDIGGTQVVSVEANGQVEVIYEGEPGPLGYAYLNGLLIEWQVGKDMIGVSKKVVERGDPWDNTLNTNDTVTISALSAGTLNATGSNTN